MVLITLKVGFPCLKRSSDMGTHFGTETNVRLIKKLRLRLFAQPCLVSSKCLRPRFSHSLRCASFIACELPSSLGELATSTVEKAPVTHE
jgi:hypothetical protein